MISSILIALLLLQAAAPPADAPKPPEPRATEKAPEKEESPVVTHHEMRAGTKSLKYTATAGLMPIRNAKGETEAHMFFVAYTLDGVSDAHRRPLMFSF